MDLHHKVTRSIFFKVKRQCLIALLMGLSFRSQSQQVADTLYNPPILNAAYPLSSGPVIHIDQAHHNFHTLSGRFKPFANLLQRDGYNVKASDLPFSKASLEAASILVIANAIHPDNERQWTLPTPSAFSEEEIMAVNEWVKAGGSLLLIADHMPFPGASEQLAASFGVKFYNGFVRKKKNNDGDIFERSNGLRECALTNGRTEDEKVSSLQSFTGQAFEIPVAAVPVIVLDAEYELLLPQTAWQFNKDTSRASAAGLVQGAYMNYGSGRLVVFGEAAMFTAQREGKNNKFGMNSPSAKQNA